MFITKYRINQYSYSVFSYGQGAVHGNRGTGLRPSGFTWQVMSARLAGDVIHVWKNSSPSNHCISHFKAQLAQYVYVLDKRNTLAVADFPRDVCLTVSRNHKVFLLYSHAVIWVDLLSFQVRQELFSCCSQRAEQSVFCACFRPCFKGRHAINYDMSKSQTARSFVADTETNIRQVTPKANIPHKGITQNCIEEETPLNNSKNQIQNNGIVVDGSKTDPNDNQPTADVYRCELSEGTRCKTEEKTNLIEAETVENWHWMWGWIFHSYFKYWNSNKRIKMYIAF